MLIILTLLLYAALIRWIEAKPQNKALLIFWLKRIWAAASLTLAVFFMSGGDF